MKSGGDYREKRLFCRKQVDADVAYTVHGEKNQCVGRCRNLSHLGIQFETERDLSEGSCLKVIIDTKSKKYKPVNTIVKIFCVEPSQKNNYHVAGKIIEFK